MICAFCLNPTTECTCVSKPKIAPLYKEGRCSVCGTNNSKDVQCNCANVPAETVTPNLGMKFDTGKLQYSLIPPETLTALAEVLTFGARKYAPNNWVLVQDGETRYLDAAFRHLEAFRKGETHDPESGLHHLAHLLTNVAFLHYLHTKTKD